MLIRRLAYFLFSLTVAASFARADTPAERVSCEVRGATALAESLGVSLKDLPGIDKETELSVRYRNGKPTSASVRSSSGNSSLDAVFKSCKLLSFADKDATYTGTFTFFWRTALGSREGHADPHAIGAPHACRFEDMDSALERMHEGATGLAFDVSTRGLVDNLIIVSSSGWIDLDLAAAKCVAKWIYEPAKTQGAAIAVPWDAQVSWAIDSSRHFNLPLPQTRISSCVASYSDVADQLSKSNGVSFVRYRLKDGVVSDVSIRESSANAILDAHALDCVHGWKFKPLYDNGAAANGSHIAIIDWGQKALP